MIYNHNHPIHIVYSSKYGTVKKCVKLLEQQLSCRQIITTDINAAEPPDSTGCDLIIGGAIYHGKLSPELLKYITATQKKSSALRYGLFICSLDLNQNTQEWYLQRNNITPEPFDIISFFGGELRVDQLSSWDKFKSRMIFKTKQSVEDLQMHEIENFSSFWL